MKFPRSFAVCNLLFAGLLFGCEPDDTPPSPEAVNWVSVDIDQVVRKSPSVEEARRLVAEQFRVRDLDGGGISESDRKFQRGAELAQARAIRMRTWLAMDLDGDGTVAKLEIEQFFGASIWRSLRQARPMPNGESPEVAAKRIRDEKVAAELRADKDRDGVVTLQEMLALPFPGNQERPRRLELAPAYLDSDKDGVVSEDEYLRIVDIVLATADPNGDGEISNQEKSEFTRNAMQLRMEIEQAARARREIEMATDMTETCGFPEVPPKAQIILVESASGTGLSTVGLGDEVSMVTVGDVRIEPGEEPLYIVLYGMLPMIWRFDGATERVVQVVAGVRGSDAGGALKAGVTGLPAARVFVPEFHECAKIIAGLDEAAAKHAARKLGAMLGRPVTTTLVISTLNTAVVPSGRFENGMVLPGAVEVPVGTRGETMWRAMQIKHQGGLLQIAPGDVRSRAKPMPYELLPGSAGLAQLADRGAIEILETRNAMISTREGFAPYPAPARILVREKIRLPGGLRSVTIFELAPGVPAPDNLPRGAKVMPLAN